MFDTLKPHLEAELQKIRDAGLWKDERVLASAQGAEVRLADGRDVLVFCANNYLGLSSHPKVIEAAHRALDSHGFGLSRSEEHTSELQSQFHLVCRLLLEKKKKQIKRTSISTQ